MAGVRRRSGGTRGSGTTTGQGRGTRVGVAVQGLAWRHGHGEGDDDGGVSSLAAMAADIITQGSRHTPHQSLRRDTAEVAGDEEPVEGCRAAGVQGGCLRSSDARTTTPQYYNTPVLLHPSTPTPQYSYTPVLPHPSTTTPQYYDTPVLQHPSTPTPQYSYTPVLRHPSTMTPQYYDTPVLRHPSTPTPQYSYTPVLLHRSTTTPQYYDTTVLVQPRYQYYDTTVLVQPRYQYYDTTVLVQPRYQYYNTPVLLHPSTPTPQYYDTPVLRPYTPQYSYTVVLRHRSTTTPQYLLQPRYQYYDTTVLVQPRYQYYDAITGRHRGHSRRPRESWGFTAEKRMIQARRGYVNGDTSTQTICSAQVSPAEQLRYRLTYPQPPHTRTHALRSVDGRGPADRQPIAHTGFSGDTAVFTGTCATPGDCLPRFALSDMTCPLLNITDDDDSVVFAGMVYASWGSPQGGGVYPCVRHAPSNTLIARWSPPTHLEGPPAGPSRGPTRACLMKHPAGTEL
ncbi:unnamed protein product [Gadus morhua 'NCC']